MAQPQTIARPYAKAIFGLAEDEHRQQRWQHFLDAAAVLAESPDVMQYLHTPDFATQVNRWLEEWLNKSRGEGLNDEEQNFMSVLAEHDRFAILPEIAQTFAELCAESRNVCIAHVKSAQALDGQAQKALVNMLEQKLGKSVSLEIEEEPALMAGVVIEYDGQVINHSLQGRLQRFARKLDD